MYYYATECILSQPDIFEKVAKSGVWWPFSLWKSPNLLTIKSLLEINSRYNVFSLDTVNCLDKNDLCAYEKICA